MDGLPEGMVCGLAEVVLRVKDLDRMQAFYADVVGLALWRRFGRDMVFFKLAEAPGERPQALALFAEHWPPNVPGPQWAGLDASTTTMHHFALSVALPSLRTAAELLATANVQTIDRIFAWAGWRSLMLRDPEGNVIELVAVDPDLMLISD